MGSSWWSCWTDYREPIERAFAEAQSAEFARWHGELQFIIEHRLNALRQYGGPDPGVIGTAYEYSSEDVERWLSRPQPESLDDLVKILGWGGAGSIIDVKGISASPKHPFSSSLPIKRQMELFETEQPSRDAIERLLQELPDEGASCNYIVAFEGGSPSEVCFVGVTGD